MQPVEGVKKETTPLAEEIKLNIGALLGLVLGTFVILSICAFAQEFVGLCRSLTGSAKLVRVMRILGFTEAFFRSSDDFNSYDALVGALVQDAPMFGSSRLRILHEKTRLWSAK